MDSSYYYIPFVLYFVGLIAAFFSAVFSGLSSQEFKELSEKKPEIGERIQTLRKRYSESRNPFFAIEILFYLSATSMLTALFIVSPGIWYELFIVLPISFLLVLIVRTVFYALGSNLRSQSIVPLLGIVQFYVALSCPFDKMISFINNKITKGNAKDNSLQELTALVDTVCEEGTLEFGEFTLLRNIIKFKEVYVQDIMTPRTVIFSCSAESTVREVVNLPEIQMYSRFPLRDGETLDDGVVGYAMSKDIFRAALAGKWDTKLKDLAREIYFVPENSSLEITLELLLKQKQLLLLAVDEYGGIEGLISMEDIIETMLGAEIVDEADRVADLRELAKLRRDKRIAEALTQIDNK